MSPVLTTRGESVKVRENIHPQEMTPSLTLGRFVGVVLAVKTVRRGGRHRVPQERSC